jgi:ribonuclease HI
MDKAIEVTKPIVEMYTDGACSGNPGDGGWGTVLISDYQTKNGKKRHYKELSGAVPNTTNNRMELTAVLEGFKALKKPCSVLVVTDSKYVCDSFLKNWIVNWQVKGWHGVKNPDLWQALLQAIKGHDVTWQWVKGHSGHPENERCDSLARQAILDMRAASLL